MPPCIKTAASTTCCAPWTPWPPTAAPSPKERIWAPCGSGGPRCMPGSGTRRQTTTARRRKPPRQSGGIFVYIVVLNGPNLNMLGIRQPEIYGHETYEDLKAMIQQEADSLGVRVSFFQSNHEGALVDAIPAGLLRQGRRHHHQSRCLYPYQHRPAGRGQGRAHSHGGSPHLRPGYPGGVPPYLLYPRRLHRHHPGSRPGRLCGGPAAAVRQRDHEPRLISQLFV